MKYKLLALLLGIWAFCSVIMGKEVTVTENKLWYSNPAGQWEETLPLGNGRLGMMPDGGVDRERIVLNEITMWSGSEDDYNNPQAAACLPAIRSLLFEGKNAEAQKVMYEHFVPLSEKVAKTYGNYEILANLDLEYSYPTPDLCTNYQRSLELSNGIARTRFEKGNTHYNRDYFVSKDKDVMVIRLSKKGRTGKIAFRSMLSRPERAIVRTEGNALILEGKLDSGKESLDGMKFIVRMQVETVKGVISVKNDRIEVTDADEALILLSAKTDFYRADYQAICSWLLENAIKTPYNQLKKDHIIAFKDLYDRTSLTLGKEDTRILQLPTDRRIIRFQEQDDPALAALYYNYGRYLLISSTRPGSLPPNLQGLWANTCTTPWNGDYHLNINVQMNHWPVEAANLSELHLPLINLTEGLVKNGESTAKAFYGEKARGWVAHMKTNVWNFTAPGEKPSWGATNTGGAWLCAHLWEHYLFTGDKAYLREVYPVMKGAADFFLSTMVEEPIHGWLVTAPSSSPENSFRLVKGGPGISVCMGPTMDIQLIRELYTNVIEAAGILGVDAGYVKELSDACMKFPPHQISKEGYLQEWLQDYEETDIHHRHVSHLYGLYPGNQISPGKTPELAEACKKTLERRGDGGTGWSRAWKINFWARLRDGNRAYHLFKSLLTPAYTVEEPLKHGSGTFPNLFCSHSPFQIDGNWGGTAGISEMLLQSQEGVINFLPALPDSWKEGSFRGFKVRGGGEVDLKWENGKIRKAVIKAMFDNDFHVNIPGNVVKVRAKAGKKSSIYENVRMITLNVKAGEKVELDFM